jgi:hypothetical protein
MPNRTHLRQIHHQPRTARTAMKKNTTGNVRIEVPAHRTLRQGGQRVEVRPVLRVVAGDLHLRFQRSMMRVRGNVAGRWLKWAGVSIMTRAVMTRALCT